MKRLTKKGFREWLQRQAAEAPDRIVGIRRRNNCCPVALYLRTLGVARPLVSAWTVGAEDAGYVCPAWVTRFVLKLDGGHKLPVTAADALAVLDGETER